jgi:hypothetical protein
VKRLVLPNQPGVVEAMGGCRAGDGRDSRDDLPI